MLGITTSQDVFLLTFWGIIPILVLFRGLKRGLRKLLNQGLWWLVGFSYATIEGTHVRNDILYNRFSKIWQLRIDFWAHLLLVVPFVAVAMYHSWDFVSWAWKQNEGSIDPGGLPSLWIIKSTLLLGFGLFGAAALSRSIALAVDIRNLKKAWP